MDSLPRISDSEWLVMKRLWDVHFGTAQEIATALTEETAWNISTVKTLLNRLVSKGAVGFTKAGREHRYHPLLTEDECRRAESKSFLKRVFGGSLRPMLATLLEDESISAKEVEALKALLEQKAKSAGRQTR
jgi:BlaI family transcriptional regulator, penicillinase repressor